ncbi:MAG: hypothetical protein JRI59_09995 [Deltaproteobacteria bacterium]|nr:hypothetical protein [Deltaproteobacteria bacterium]
MSATNEDRPLKVCFTCQYWEPKLKGFCQRLQQGVGKFHICEDWSSAAQETADTLLAEPQKAAGTGRV